MPCLMHRFPVFAASLIRRLSEDPGDASSLGTVQCLHELHRSAAALRATGVTLPAWEDAFGGQPMAPNDIAVDPGEHKHGWQYRVSCELETLEREAMLIRLSESDRARVRSCGGHHNALWLTAAPTMDALRLRNPVLQALLRRRLGLPIIALPERCEAASCRREVDAYGFHRSACTRTGRIHGRHAACLGPWRIVLEEAGYRVRAERLLRDTNVSVGQGDLRRMDLVAAPGARGPGAHRGRALFCDVSVVSPQTRDGAARPGAANRDGAVLNAVLQRKRERYSDVVRSGVSHLVVLGCEVYGHWCTDAVDLIRQLVRCKVRDAPAALRGAASQAWTR